VSATPECIFCRIVAGEAPCHKVLEDELTLAFMDLFPVAAGHLLVVPKLHCQDILTAPEAALLQVMANVRRLALALQKALAPDGIGIHQLNGAAAGQTVFHYHTHLIPRHRGDPIALHGRQQGRPEELEALAEGIREALAD